MTFLVWLTSERERSRELDAGVSGAEREMQLEPQRADDPQDDVGPPAVPPRAQLGGSAQCSGTSASFVVTNMT